MSVNEKMTAIADTIRSFTGKPGKLGLDDMPGAINEAVEANGYEEGYQNGYDEGEENGYINGYADGNDDGIEEGKQAEYDRFWDAYQQNGNRTDYANAFSGRGWTEETYTPKYDVVVTNAYMLFRYCGIKDLGEAIRKSGKRLVIQHNSPTMAFNNTLMEIIDGVEFATTLTNLSQCFNYSNYLREIRVPLPITETTNVNGFDGCNALEKVSFSGVIGQSTDLYWSTKLSHDTIVHIIETLSDTATGKTLTLSKTAVTNAFGSTTAAEWTALAGTKPNWTISLV